MPDGAVAMVINLKDDHARIYDPKNLQSHTSFPGALVSGPHSDFFVIDTAGQASVIGIQFRPGGAFPFFKLPLDELHNLHVSLVDLWGVNASLLREQLLEAETPGQKFQVLENCLMGQAFKPLARHRAVEGALALFRNIHPAPAMARVSDQIGISSRRLIQLFSQQVGLTPKLFCRVRRFQRVLHLIHQNQASDWVDLAAGCGYFDQAHFIHDFRAFSGVSPSAYLKYRTSSPNHVAMQD